MSKHSVRQPKPAIAKHSAPLRRRDQRQQLIAACVLLSLIGAGAALAQWRSLSASAKLNMASAPPMLLAQTTNNLAPNTPAKEYVYAGGRLLATEEPALTNNNATFVSQTVPATMVNGQSYAVTVMMRNSGATTWTSGALYRLGSQNPQDNLTWGMGRVELPSAVAPGATATFNFTVTSPSTAGNHNFQWRMVQEGVEWFGDTAPNVAVAVNSVPTNNARYYWQSAPATMVAGQSYPVTIMLTNTGNTTWTPTGTNPYSLASLSQTWGINNVSLAGAVTPNGTVTFSFNVTAPSTPGTYSFQWRMLQQNVEWFGEYTPAISVTVTAPAGSGALSGGVASMGTTTVNLSQEGTLDWAHWGQSTAASFDHKASVAQQIGNYWIIGSGVVNAYSNHNYGFSWTNGIPTPSATATTTGVYVTGLGNGYRITVLADTTTRTLKLYTGVFYAQGKLEASLSDNSSPAYIDTSLNNNAGVSNGVYTLAYRAASAGQTLTVSFTMQNDYGGNVAMQAATLSGSGSTSLTAPSNLVATATSTTQVALSWTASTGGTVDHYRVERSQSFGAPFIPLQASPAGTNFTDTTATSGVAYLYRVCAVDAAGNLSAYSNVDLATTIIFTDRPLVSGVTAIRALHLVELRQAVNAVRALAGLSPAAWQYPDPVSSPPEQRRPVYLEDVQDLRTNLDAALNVLGRNQPYPANPPLARFAPIAKDHFTQIRDRVKGVQ